MQLAYAYHIKSGSTHITSLFGIPEAKELVEGPFDTLDSFLLSLRSILGGEGQGINIRPVWVQIEV
jgi:hypothetical protein